MLSELQFYTNIEFIVKMIKRPNFRQQLLALMKRNILLKKRNVGQLLWVLTTKKFDCNQIWLKIIVWQQTVFPIVFVSFIILNLKSTIGPKHIRAIPEPIGTGNNWKDKKYMKWKVGPENDFTTKIREAMDQTLRVLFIGSIDLIITQMS